ncbi:MAG: hypothetical protein KGY76_00965 [Candidatus Thermoplasmatota archaeon]|nr:hypothetical protein [Candidatus Thermoplasmatota archaeon]
MKGKKIVNMVVIALLLISLLTLLVTPAAAQSGDIYSTDREGEKRSEFLVDQEINFRVFADPGTEYRVRLMDENDETVDQIVITTDQDGVFRSAEDPTTFFQHDVVGNYYLELYHTGEGAVVDTKDILIYEEQIFTQQSRVDTYETSERENPDYSNFDESETVYFTAKVRDQHGHPPEAQMVVNIRVEKGGETVRNLGNYNLDGNGNVEDNFGAWELGEPGDYSLVIYSQQGGEREEYGSGTFTVVGVEIFIDQEYTQGQTMEIRIESNYEKEVDISIQNSTQDPYRIMDGAEWTDQEFTDQLWTEEYTIPEDEVDGTYYVVVKADGDTLGDPEPFKLKKYSLEATTDKRAYLPGESVDVYYTVEEQIDGSRAEDLNVEYRIMYQDQDLEMNVISEDLDTYDDHFSFEIRDDIYLPSSLNIELWANGTDEDHTTHWSSNVWVGELVVDDFSTDKGEYLQGETIYVSARTIVQGSDVGVEDADIEVILKKEGEVINDYDINDATGDNGEVVVPVSTPSNSAGIYTLNMSAEKNDFISYPEEKQVEIKEEINNLNVHLDRDQHSYSPGETVEVSYSVTKGGELVDANVQYEVTDGAMNSNRVYFKGFAEGGTIEFTVPDNFDQDKKLYLKVDAKVDQKTTGSDQMEIPISEIELLLNADKNEYEGGETIGFEYEIIGGDSTNTERYKIIDELGDVLKTGEPEGNEFEFNVPEEPASMYRVKMEVVSSGNILVEEELTIYQKSRIQIEINIATESSYTTGVYEPGQELKVDYKLRAVGDAKLPDKITLQYGFYSTGKNGQIQTDSPEGSFTINAPEASEGTYHLYVQSPATEGYSSNIEPIKVKEDPSAMNLKTVAGVSLLGLLGIIVLVIILLIGGYMLFMKEGGEGPDIFKGREKEKEEMTEEKEEPAETRRIREEERSPREEAHGWKGPEESEGSGEVEQIEETEESDQIEPDDEDIE